MGIRPASPFGKFHIPLFIRGVGGGIGRIIRFGFSPRAWKGLLAEVRTRRLVKASGLVDVEWYRREYPDVEERGGDPVGDFLAPPHLSRRMPCPDFVPEEYAALHFDVKASGIPWALHYVRDGMREGRPASMLDRREVRFPEGTEELRLEFPAAGPVRRRTAVFASFSKDGRISKAVLSYLNGLKEVVDNIVFVADNPVFPAEASKLAGLVRLAVFRRHGHHDFGSYRTGWEEAKALGLLAPDVCDELVMCNDSCYGPVFPFSEAFAEMERRNRTAQAGRRFDFWGMTAHALFGRPHVQSYFCVFGKAVLEERTLDDFFREMEPCRERGQVVYFCETWLSTVLLKAHHRFDTLVPRSFSSKRSGPPIKYPVSLLSAFRMPLLKAKTLQGESKENLAEAMAIVRKSNPALADILPLPPAQTTFERPCPGPTFPEARKARETHLASLENNLERLRKAWRGGHSVRVLSLTASAIPFHGGDLMAALEADANFRPAAAVVPDFRLGHPSEWYAAMRDARAAIGPQKRLVRAEPDVGGEWPDLAADADIVCWETAENISTFRYNPHWAVGRPFLPVLFFDRRTAGPYRREKEFARQNYAYFWKVFFDDPEDFRLYAAHSLRRGGNAVLIPSGDWGEGVRRVLAAELGG